VHYRLLAPSGEVLEEGGGEAGVLGGALTVTPAAGQPVRVRPTDVTEISEPQPYVLRLLLAEGPTLELARLGVLHTQVLSDFAAVRKKGTVDSLLLAGVGLALAFPGAIGEVEAEIRLYDDRLLVLPVAGEPRSALYSFVDDVSTDRSGYRINVTAGGQAWELHQLAQRTSEFVQALRERMERARTRTGAVIESLLPGLGSLALRSVAARLRDGVPVRAADLDAVERTVSSSLLAACGLEDRLPGVADLAAQGDLWLALYQRGSVEVAATGGADLRAPRIRVGVDHRPPASYGGGLGGFGGLLAAEMLSGPDHGGPFGPALYDGLVGGTSPRQHRPRREPRTGGSDVPHTDFAALAVHGEDTTVLAMAFVVLPAERVIVHEMLNDGGYPTFVYDIGSGGAVTAVAEVATGLALIGYRMDVLDADVDSAGSGYGAAARLPHVALLRAKLRGRVAHGDDRPAQLATLLD
jgi:hypothetical protein